MTDARFGAFRAAHPHLDVVYRTTDALSCHGGIDRLSASAPAIVPRSAALLGQGANAEGGKPMKIAGVLAASLNGGADAGAKRIRAGLALARGAEAGWAAAG